MSAYVLINEVGGGQLKGDGCWISNVGIWESIKRGPINEVAGSVMWGSGRGDPLMRWLEVAGSVMWGSGSQLRARGYPLMRWLDQGVN